MIYWYNTAMEIDSIYQLEKLKTHYYAKITGVQANSYEALQSVYDNKQAIDKAIADEKEQAVNELKKRNRKLVTHNVVLSVGLTALAFTTCYLAIF
jgi:hypothetical protein